MADPTNPGQPSDSATERGSPVNVNSATVDNVTVTRMAVDTGEIKTLQADLLAKLCDCVDAQTATLGKFIDESKKEMVAAIKAGGGGSGSDDGDKKRTGGDPDLGTGSAHALLSEINANMKAMVSRNVGGGGDGGDAIGGSFASAKAHQKAWDTVGKSVKKGTIEFGRWRELFNEGVNIQFQKNLTELNQKVLNFGSDLVNVSSGLGKAMSATTDIFKMGQGGLIEATSLFEDLGAGLIQGRDAMQSTVKSLVELREANMTLIGSYGSNLKELSQTFRRNRDAMEEAFGEDFMERIPFEDQNVILTQILGQQRRLGVKGDDRDIIQSRLFREQSESLRTIAFMTGKTVEEVAKLQEESAMSLAELVFNNLLTKAQADAAVKSEGMLEGAGQGGIADFARGIIEAGGMEMAMQNEGFAAMAKVPGNMERIQKIMDGYLSGTSAGVDSAIKAASELKGMNLNKEAMAELRKLFPEMKEIGLMQGQAARFRADPEKSGGVQAAERAKEEAKGTLGASVQGAFNAFNEFIANNLGGGGDLAIALGYNTAAVIANTFSRGGGALLKGLFGKMGKMGGFMGRMASRMIPAGMKNPATMAAQTGAGAILAKSTLGGATHSPGVGKAAEAGLKGGAKAAGKGIGKSLLKKIPLIGLGAGLLFGAQRLLAGDFLGAGMEVASGAASTIPGLGTAASVGIDAALIGRDVMKANTPDPGVAARTGIGSDAVVAPSEVSSPTVASAPMDNPFFIEIQKQSVLLEQVTDLLTFGNTTRTSMLESIELLGTPTLGLSTSPKQRRGVSTPADAYTPLLEGPSA